ncbi:hypothetical protein HMN09_00941500 [Mycena chlorophos]|uniref:Uncharacterized protein n=1 Tax=Mycena chlorophos TaxID=658473 RepID=A0A8H6SKY2_MYCCL|nr:hypothetical protein HMN09_00941500 [Mycena chlorophos]
MSCTTKSPTTPLRSALKKTKRSASALRAPLPFVPPMLATVQHDRASASRAVVQEPEDYEAPPLFTIPNYQQAEPSIAAEELSPLDGDLFGRPPAAARRELPRTQLPPRRSFDSLASTVVTEASSALNHQPRRSSSTTLSSNGHPSTPAKNVAPAEHTPPQPRRLVQAQRDLFKGFRVHQPTVSPQASRAVETAVAVVCVQTSQLQSGPAPVVSPVRNHHRSWLRSKLDFWRH